MYNKNEAYEKELRRDEHRKLMLRIKRQTSWSSVSSRHKSFHHLHSRSNAFGSLRRLRLKGKLDDGTENANDDMVDGYDDHGEGDLGYGDTDMDDTNDDGFGDDTEPASDTDTLDLPKISTRPKIEKRRKKYKLRGRRMKFLDVDSDLDQVRISSCALKKNLVLNGMLTKLTKDTQNQLQTLLLWGSAVQGLQL